jgi:hypothetical protein
MRLQASYHQVSMSDDVCLCSFRLQLLLGAFVSVLWLWCHVVGVSGQLVTCWHVADQAVQRIGTQASANPAPASRHSWWW